MGLPALPVRWKPHLSYVTWSILLCALILRLAAASGELWLDEVWSLRNVEPLQSPLAIVTQLKHDNNHFLNSLYLYSLGAGWPWFVYRLPSIVAGVATVVIAGHVAGRWGRVERTAAMILFATAYLLVHYSSEARGYSMMLLCCTAAYSLLTQFLKTGHVRWAGAFALVATIGFAAQPLFLHFYLAALAWSTARVAQRNMTIQRKLAWLAACHALPSLFLAALYGINLREVRLGGGPKSSVLGTLCEAASLTLGGPAAGLGAIVATAILVVAVAGGCCLLRAKCNDEWKLLMGVVIVPLLPLLVTQPPFLYPRYFLISATFSLLAIACGLGWVWRQGRYGRLLSMTMLAAFVVGNGLHTRALLQHGRGEFAVALQYIVASDPSPVITLTSDHNHGLGMLTEFYGAYLPPGRDVNYVNCQPWPAKPPTWLLFHVLERADTEFDTELEILDDGSRYKLQRSYATPRLSGWGLRCYRLVPSDRNGPR